MHSWYAKNLSEINVTHLAYDPFKLYNQWHNLHVNTVICSICHFP